MRVIIMSGISGAGKDTYIKGVHPTAQVVSADHFFMVGGEYRFDPTKLGYAHASCMRDFITKCQKTNDAQVMLGRHSGHIIVNNTNTTTEEIAPYYSVAKAFGAEVTLLTLHCDPEIAAKRNVHGVPLQAIRAMAQRIADRRIPPFWDIRQIERLPS